MRECVDDNLKIREKEYVHILQGPKQIFIVWLFGFVSALVLIFLFALIIIQDGISSLEIAIASSISLIFVCGGSFAILFALWSIRKKVITDGEETIIAIVSKEEVGCKTES